jgi:hypothetical protein
MRNDLTLGAWLAAAVVLHFATAACAPRLGLPEMAQFYGVVLAYAVPVALGLRLTGRLKPWRAVGFAALVVAAHAVAVVAAIAMTPTVGLSAAMMMRSGAVAGALGASLSLFGLVGLRGAPTRSAFALAAAFSLVLTLAGLLLVPALDAPTLPKELALPLVLYLPWQMVFSFAVALIARPAGGTSRSGARPSPEPARS